MLVVAIPKSASSSFLHSLGNATDIPTEQCSFGERRIPGTFELLAGMHSDCREIDLELTQQLAVADRLYKQHLPPTENNVDLLDSVPKIVLLRDSADIVLAYRRGTLTGVHGARPGFEECRSEHDWLRRAEEVGLVDELERFADGWLGATNVHVIRYAEVVTDPTAAIHSAAEFLDLELARPVRSLAKLRYSRSPVRNGLRRARNGLIDSRRMLQNRR